MLRYILLLSDSGSLAHTIHEHVAFFINDVFSLDETVSLNNVALLMQVWNDS
jgi:hypothetical protein